jgi:PAS domain S-box-containing protein
VFNAPSNVVLILGDAHGAQMFVSANAHAIVGYTPQELMGFDSRALIHPDDRDVAAGAAARVLAEPAGAPVVVRFRFRHRDGRWLRVESSLTRVDAAGVAYAMWVRDVSAESDLAAWYALTMSANPQAILVVGADGFIRDANEGARALFSRDGAALAGVHLDALVPPHGRAHHAAGFSHAAAAAVLGRTREVAAQTLEGTEFPARVHVREVTLNGELCFASFVEDLSHVTTLESHAAQLRLNAAALAEAHQGLQREVEEQTQAIRAANQDLSHANAALEQASRVKDVFLANMSHELRTPLNGVIGLTESLREGVYGPVLDRQTQALDRIEESGRHLLSLINDVLDFSRLQAYELELDVDAIDLRAVCDAALSLVRPSALSRRLTFSTTFWSRGRAYGDARRVKQVLVNLLSNAVKFTPDGGTIGLEVHDDADGREVRVTVSDTGVGIAPDDLPRLFRPFAQVDTLLTRQQAGWGLGLALVRSFVELHGGAVSVTSEPGAGSRFTFTLPVSAPPPQGAASRAQLHASNSPAVFIVEDSPDVAALHGRYLRELGFSSVVSPDGVDAVARALDASARLVLLDLFLPDETGWDVLRELRRDARTADLPVLVVSAVERGREALARGANAFLRKPVARDALRRAVEVLRAIPAATPASAPSRRPPALAPAPARRPRALIADDEPVNIETVADFLAARGFDVDIASDGLEAIARASACPPDVILMDIQMPRLDGLAATRTLRASEAPGQRTPIVAVTALAMEGDRERCLAAGCDAYVSKPVRLRDLLEVVNGLLRRARP